MVLSLAQIQNRGYGVRGLSCNNTSLTEGNHEPLDNYNITKISAVTSIPRIYNNIQIASERKLGRGWEESDSAPYKFVNVAVARHRCAGYTSLSGSCSLLSSPSIQRGRKEEKERQRQREREQTRRERQTLSFLFYLPLFVAYLSFSYLQAYFSPLFFSPLIFLLFYLFSFFSPSIL